MTASRVDMTTSGPAFFMDYGTVAPGTEFWGARIENSTFVEGTPSRVWGSSTDTKVEILNSTLFAAPESPFIVTHNASLDLLHATSMGGVALSGAAAANVQNSAFALAGSQGTVETDGSAVTVTGAGNISTQPFPDAALGTVVAEDAMLLEDLSSSGPESAQVRLPSEGSPLLDAAEGEALSLDQRGLPRMNNGRHDVGAVELQTAHVVVGDAGSVKAGQTAVFPVTVTKGGERAATVEIATGDDTALEGREYTAAHTTIEIPANAGGTDLQFEVPTIESATAGGTEFVASAKATAGRVNFEPDTGRAQLISEKPPVVTPPVTKPPVGPPTPPVAGGEQPGVSVSGGGAKTRPAGTLATTGVESSSVLWLGGSALLVAGAAATLFALRRRQS